MFIWTIASIDQLQKTHCQDCNKMLNLYFIIKKTLHRSKPPSPILERLENLTDSQKQGFRAIPAGIVPPSLRFGRVGIVPRIGRARALGILAAIFLQSLQNWGQSHFHCRTKKECLNKYQLIVDTS